MVQTPAEIRNRFDKADRMNRRDIADLFEHIDEQRSYLQRIADLPKRIGYFNGADAATEAVRLAKGALSK